MPDARHRLPTSVTFGQRLRALRTERGWTLRKLATDSGVHYTYLGYVERGQRNPTLLTIVRLCDALEVDPAVLVKGMRSKQAGRQGPVAGRPESR